MTRSLSFSFIRSRSPASRGLRAFTLIELLTVIAIIGILAAILVPVVGHARASAAKAQSISNLRQIGIAVQLHVGENAGLMPAHSGVNPFWRSLVQAGYLPSDSVFTARGDDSGVGNLPEPFVKLSYGAVGWGTTHSFHRRSLHAVEEAAKSMLITEDFRHRKTIAYNWFWQSPGGKENFIYDDNDTVRVLMAGLNVVQVSRADVQADRYRMSFSYLPENPQP